jgi:hypothetical protein
MRGFTGWRVVAVGALLSAGCAAHAQETKNPIDTKPEGQGKQCQYTITGSSGTVTGTSNCTPQTPANTPTTQKFPYPGEAGAMDAPAAPEASAPAAQTQQPAPGGGKFPFPGDTPAAAATAGGGTKAAPPEAGGLQDAGSSGESSSSSGGGGMAGSSSSSSSSSSSDSPDDVNSDTPPAPKRNQHKKPPPPDKTASQQEAEDLQVAGFYMNDSNWRGAYSRAVDAVKLSADDADAHLALADAARKLGKLDEAESNYRKALQLDPVPKTRKAAEKALKEMSGDA